MTFRDVTVTGQRFPNFGRAVITADALAFCEDHGIDYLDLLIRHAAGDFGDVGRLDDAQISKRERELGALATDDSLKLNAVAVTLGEGMVMSVYSPAAQESKVWIQTMLAGTETYTTVMLPSEY